MRPRRSLWLEIFRVLSTMNWLGKRSCVLAHREGVDRQNSGVLILDQINIFWEMVLAEFVMRKV